MSFNKDTGMYEGYIYLATNKINGKQYIGQTTTTIKNRFMEHCCKAETDVNYFHNALNKYGKDNFELIELDMVQKDNPEDLSEVLNNGEIYFISKYDTLAPNGYNLTNGGGNSSIRIQKPVCQYDITGKFITRYDSATIASEKLGVNRKGISNCCNRKVFPSGKRIYSYVGFIWRFENDIDISDSVEYLTARIKKIFKYDEYGNQLCVFNNLQEAAFDAGDIKSVETIRKCCNNLLSSYKGYLYSYENGSFKKNSNKQSVCQYALEDGKFIKQYPSIVEAQKSTGIHHGVIGSCCRKECKTAGGYIWRYEDEKLTQEEIERANTFSRPNMVSVSQYTLKGEFIKTYESMTEAYNNTGAHVSNIKHCCDGILKQTNGFIWKYADDPITQEDVDVFNQPHFNSKQLNRYTLDGKYIDTFESVAYLYREFGYSQGNISMCCRGVRNTAYGYKWFYADDPNQPDKTKIMKKEVA